MKTYGVQASDDTWLEWLTLHSRAPGPRVGWTTKDYHAWGASEREAKAVASLLPLDEKHPLRVRPLPGVAIAADEP